jgi:hypothetical protein
MARPAIDDEEDKPLDPAVEKVRRKLVRFVAINLGLLFVALIAVAIAIVYKSRSEAPATPPVASDIPVPPGAALEGEIPLPVGSRIVSQSLSGSRLSLDVEAAGGGRTIILYDLAERRIIGRFAVVER